jgi:hypothetical protein
LVFKGVPVEAIRVIKDNGLSFSPVSKIELGAILRRDGAHGTSPDGGTLMGHLIATRRLLADQYRSFREIQQVLGRTLRVQGRFIEQEDVDNAVFNASRRKAVMQPFSQSGLVDADLIKQKAMI